MTTRQQQASANHQQGLNRVTSTPEPAGQKFPCGSRVRVSRDDSRGDMPGSRSHFPNYVNATVEYVYAHAYGGDDVKSYSLDIDNHGSVSWFPESDLSELETPND